MASRTQMPVEQFVEEVVLASRRGMSISQLAKKIRKAPMTVYLRHYWLRRNGVPLPPLAMRRETVEQRAMKALRRAAR